MRLTARCLRALRRRLGGEAGFTMPAVLGAMLVVSLLSVAAIAAASGDIRLARNDQDDKDSLAAAEAGVNDYLGHLNSDSNFWAKCTNTGDVPVSQKGTTGASRRWKAVAGGTSEYSIELIPAPGYTQCLSSNATASMVDQGNIRIRSTGRVRGGNGAYQYRTLNATYRRAGFLDFLYYTDFENQDPTYFKATKYANASQYPDLQPSGSQTLDNFIATECNKHWSEGRSDQPKWQGNYQATYFGYPYRQSVSLGTGDLGCGEIQFASDDQVNGPFHSNDDILTCGTPDFGRSNGSDRVEISGRNYRSSGSCSGSPNFRPSLLTQASTLDPPATNGALKTLTQPGYSFTGSTKIVLNGTSMNVTNGGSTQTLALPSNGVIYVSNDTCAAGYDPLNASNRPAGCGDVELSGTYSKDLTIASENDIIIAGNVTQVDGSDSVLGLIANAFVRVSHKVSSTSGTIDNGSCSTDSDSLKNARIDAAILTLRGSFTVDNYWCGGALGTLTVNGAIAQRHRGVVGKGTNGYIKNYVYDNRLQFRSPPFFLDPLQSAWRTLSQGEQSPPTKG